MKTVNFNLTPGELQKGDKINEELRSIKENFSEVITWQGEQELTADELDAINDANTPSALNTFATVEDLLHEELTPVNAVAANKLLSVSNTPSEADTVSIGGVAYRFRVYIGAAVAAAKSLVFSGVAIDQETVTIGGHAYKFVTALSAGPTVANEVLVEISAELNVNNLIAAINGAAGIGVKYSTGTVAHTGVNATKVSTDTVVATAKTAGVAGNAIALAETLTNAAWDVGATFLTGGLDVQLANDVLIGINAEAAIDNLVLAITAGATAGVNYGTGTVVNPLATAVKASASTMTATAKVKGVVGNAIVIAKSGANLSWAGNAVLLSSGIDGTVGIKGTIVWDTSYIYVCTDTNTISTSNWKKSAIS